MDKLPRHNLHKTLTGDKKIHPEIPHNKNKTKIIITLTPPHQHPRDRHALHHRIQDIIPIKSPSRSHT